MRNTQGRQRVLVVLISTVFLAIIAALDAPTVSSVGAERPSPIIAYKDLIDGVTYPKNAPDSRRAPLASRQTVSWTSPKGAVSVQSPPESTTAWYLHREHSPTSTLAYHLKLSPADTDPYILSSGNMKGVTAPYDGSFSLWDGVIGRAGVIPSGSTLTVTFWMKKTTSWGTVFPTVILTINDAWEGGVPRI